MAQVEVANNKPFNPVNGGSATTNVAVTGTAANVTISASHPWATTVRLANIGTQAIFVQFGGTATSTTSMPMAPNTVEYMTLPNDGGTTISAIAGTTGSTLYATLGVGGV